MVNWLTCCWNVLELCFRMHSWPGREARENTAERKRRWRLISSADLRMLGLWQPSRQHGFLFWLPFRFSIAHFSEITYLFSVFLVRHEDCNEYFNCKEVSVQHFGAAAAEIHFSTNDTGAMPLLTKVNGKAASAFNSAGCKPTHARQKSLLNCFNFSSCT